MRLKSVLLIVLSSIFFIAGCEFGGGGGSSATNEIPLAVVSETQSVNLGSVVTLDGSSSTDPENSPLSYNWNFTSIAESSLLTDEDITDSDSSTASFTPDKVGQYSLELTVSDGTHENTATTIITVNEAISVPANASPIADAGSDITVPTGSLVQLDGSNSSDADGDSLTFQWTFNSVPAGSALATADIIGSDSASASFTPDIAGEYSIELSVSDSVNSAVTDSVIVIAEDGILSSNTAPSADAGTDQSITLGATAILDGSASSDPDGDSLAYSWTFSTLPAASVLTDGDLSNANTDAASFVPDVSGTYVLTLTVNDGVNADVTDQTTVTVNNPNSPPTANAGADISLTLGGTVNLDGSASSDPDGDILAYAWTFSSMPAGSTLTDTDISGADTDTASFVPDVSGTFVLTLTVNDGLNPDVTDQTTVTVNDPIPGNDPPTANADADISLTLGGTANLDGSASTDPEGDTLAYTWTFSTQPAGSTLTDTDISGADTAAASFVPDISGTWVLTLTVNDGVNADVTDQTTVTVTDLPPEPEITVLESGTEILNGNTNYNLGNHSIGTVPIFTFTIQNDGTADLNLSGTPVVVFSGNDPEYTYDCSLTDSTIAPGGSTTFTVTYTPQVKNVVSYGTITIVSDDSDESTTTFTFRARAKN